MSASSTRFRRSTASLVYSRTRFSSMLDHFRNSLCHCPAETAELHRMMTDLCTVQAALMPVSVLPAPQGSTMMPLRARPLPNILDKARS
eukprot:scaffold8192_cov267-Pinguiococcus_pyrenoidosus.AAC.3